MSWCLQCGEAGTPEKAIGVDLDGEPACAIHRVKPAMEIPPVIAQPIRNKVEPAASSPLQATEQEKAAMGTMTSDPLTLEQISKALLLHKEGKTTKEIGALLGLPDWRFHQSPGWRAAKAGTSAEFRTAQLKKAKAKSAPKPELQNRPLTERSAAVGDPIVDLGVPPDTQITLTLPAWKASRLLSALL